MIIEDAPGCFFNLDPSLVLQEAKLELFSSYSKFVEVDATTSYMPPHVLCSCREGERGEGCVKVIRKWHDGRRRS